MKKPAKKPAKAGTTNPAKALSLEIVRPGSSATVAELPQLAELPLSEAQMASEIKADIERYERTSREAAFIALRIGMRLIWIRDNEAYGSLSGFIATHFGAAKGKRTLERYITTAAQFLRDAGMLDKKTHLLTGKALETAMPIMAEQLELFTDPQAKLEGAMKKLVKWVGDRGLADIYKDLESRKKSNTPPPGGKSAKNDFKGGASTRYADGEDDEAVMFEAKRDLAKEHHIPDIIAMRDGGAWQCLDEDDAAYLTNTLDQWLTLLKQHATDRQTAALKAKGGKR